MNYKKPPIIEAAFEMVFSAPLEHKNCKKLASELKSVYPNQSERRNITSEIDTQTGKVSTTVEDSGYDLRSDAATELVIVGGASIIVSQLAPYGGWADFDRRITQVLSQSHKILGAIKIKRSGLRFINRIDIPVAGDGRVETEDYVTVGPKAFSYGPEAMTQFAIQFTRCIDGGSIFYNLGCFTADSPVPNHSSLVLDIDVYRLEEASFRIDKLKADTQMFRDIKNGIFEASVTDRARKLFDGATQ